MAVLATMNLKQVQDAMKDFSERDVRNISKSAVRRSATRLKTRVKQQVPVGKGNLKKSIKVKNKRDRQTKEPFSFIYSDKGYYATLLYGERNEKGGGKTPISNPAGNWFDNTVRIYGKETEQNISEFLKKGIRRSAAKQYTKTSIRVAKVK